MSNLLQLRLAAREIFDQAVRAVDPAAAVGDRVRLADARLSTAETPVFAVAIGKAAVAMAVALEDVLSDRFEAGVIAAPAAEARKLSKHWQYFEGGHPLPNEASLVAAKAAFALLERANQEHALVVLLVSGGGSAMLEAPITDDIELADLRAANQVLVKCGASISEINAVRRAFSAVKGGQLSARAQNCKQITLILSDVPKGEEHNVASGPTLRPPTNAPSSAEVVERYNIGDEIPTRILHAIEHARTIKLQQSKDHLSFVLLNNDNALEAAVKAACDRRLMAEIARGIADEPIEVGCKKLLTRLANLNSSPGRTTLAGVCLISGGEFSCPVRGKGIGGRNLETALRLALAADENRNQIGDFVALCAGTDGIDGNSPAAGAIVDSTTIERARRIGLDPLDFLNRSDSYSFFVALGDAITTGPTGTNVRDLRILLSGTRQD